MQLMVPTKRLLLWRARTVQPFGRRSGGSRASVDSRSSLDGFVIRRPRTRAVDLRRTDILAASRGETRRDDRSLRWSDCSSSHWNPNLPVVRERVSPERAVFTLHGKPRRLAASRSRDGGFNPGRLPGMGGQGFVSRSLAAQIETRRRS
jgi:hypothetical protein